MSTDFDPFKILGVERTASPEEIDAAYREKVLKYHPDRGGDAWAFQQVQADYEKVKGSPKVNFSAGARPVTPRENEPDKTRNRGAQNAPRSERQENKGFSARPVYSSKAVAARRAEGRRAAAWFAVTTVAVGAIMIAFVEKKAHRSAPPSLKAQTSSATPMANPALRQRRTAQVPQSPSNPRRRVSLSSATKRRLASGELEFRIGYVLEEGPLNQQCQYFLVLVTATRRIEYPIPTDAWRVGGPLIALSKTISETDDCKAVVEEQVGAERNRISNMCLVVDSPRGTAGSRLASLKALHPKFNAAGSGTAPPEATVREQDPRVYRETLSSPAEPQPVMPPTSETGNTTTLIARLSTAPQASERSQIIRELANVPTAEHGKAIAAIAAALDDVAPDVRQCALDALRRFGDDAKGVVPTLVAYYRAEVSASKRVQILDALGDINADSNEGLSLLMEVARGAPSGPARMLSKRYGAEERTAAIANLGRLGDNAEEAVSVLLDVLKLSASDIEAFHEPFRQCADSLAKIGVSGRGVTTTVGLSVGVKGLRYGIRPDGQSYVSAGRNGLYYRRNFNSGRPRTRDLGGSSRSPLSSGSPFGHGGTYIGSKPKDGLLELLHHSSRASLQTVVIYALACIVAAFAVVASPLLGIIACIWAGWVMWFSGRWERRRRKIYLQFDANGALYRNFQNIVAGFNAVAACSSVRLVTGSAQLNSLHEVKRHGGAASLFESSAASLGEGSLPSVETNVPIPTFATRDRVLHFLPDRVLVAGRAGFSEIGYSDLFVESHDQNIIENSAFRDSVVVGSTWLHPNVDGTPDRRFSYNHRLPICRCAAISIRSTNGLALSVLASNPSVGKIFTMGFKAACGLASPAVTNTTKGSMVQDPYVGVSVEHFQSLPTALRCAVSCARRTVPIVMMNLARRVDCRLASIAGRGNTIVYRFLQCIAASATAILLVFLMWLMSNLLIW